MSPHPRVRREPAEENMQPAGSGARSSGGRERLSLVEALVAEVGGFAGAIFLCCHLPAGPLLASAGVVHIGLTAEGHETDEPGDPPASA